jgi:hypothetical protein
MSNETHPPRTVIATINHRNEMTYSFELYTHPLRKLLERELANTSETSLLYDIYSDMIAAIDQSSEQMESDANEYYEFLGPINR